MNMDPRFSVGCGGWAMGRFDGADGGPGNEVVYSCDWEVETGSLRSPSPPDVNIMPFERGWGATIHTIASGLVFRKTSTARAY